MLDQAKEVHDNNDWIVGLKTYLHLKANVRQEDKSEGEFSAKKYQGREIVASMDMYVRFDRVKTSLPLLPV